MGSDNRTLCWSELVAAAAEAGVGAELVCGLEGAQLEGSVEINSADAESVVMLSTGSGSRRVRRLLSERSQYDDGAWSYPFQADGWRSVFHVRLTRGGRSVLVPLLPAAAALAVEFGFREKLEENVAEVRVSRDEAMRAIGVLRSS